MNVVSQLFLSEEDAKESLKGLVANGYAKGQNPTRAEGEFWFRKVLAVEVCYLPKKALPEAVPVPLPPHTVRTGSPCITPDCGSPSRSRGLCGRCWNKHYYWVRQRHLPKKGRSKETVS